MRSIGRGGLMRVASHVSHEGLTQPGLIMCGEDRGHARIDDAPLGPAKPGRVEAENRALGNTGLGMRQIERA